MALPLLAAYAVMLPRLQAQESLRSVTESGIGTGSLEKSTARSLLRSWQEVLEPSARARKPTSDELASLPIRVRKVPVEKKE